MQVVFDMGEVRHIRIRVKNTDGEPFQITTAEYEITNKDTKEKIQSGQAMIIEHDMDVVFAPPARGDYKLKYTYIIGDETLVDIVEVSVL